MTVSYNHEVATGKGFGNFGRLLLRWRGGVYNLVLPELFGYGIVYAIISIIYRFTIRGHPQHQHVFDKLVKYCGDYAGVIPVSFVLGFYVSQIVTRWWNQFTTIPWPDALAAVVATSVRGTDERGRLMRRTIMRYANLSFTMTMVMLSPQAKSRFPTVEHLVGAGFMLPHEKLIYDHLNQQTDYPKYWIPIIWAGNLAARARKEGRIASDFEMVNLLKKLATFRGGCGGLLSFDWISIPLVYTQVVTLAVYLYFLAALVGKQFIEDEHELDLYVPIFLFLEFFFYMGWLKVAETMVNPFGEDDDDFEVNWLIDRNLKISYMIVDEMHQDHPELIRDQYWDEIIPADLPYTQAAERFKAETHLGSAIKAMGDDCRGQENIPFVDVNLGPEGSMLSQGSYQGSSLASGANRYRASVNPRPYSMINTIVTGFDQPPDVDQPGIIDESKQFKPYAHLMEQRDRPLHSSEMNTHTKEAEEDPRLRPRTRKSL